LVVGSGDIPRAEARIKSEDTFGLFGVGHGVILSTAALGVSEPWPYS
jgi:hypothetical protein